MTVFLLIIALILFIGLVVVHELGHFIVAKRNGVKSIEFGLGFPPRAWHKKLKSGLDFSINWLPLGGFVRLKGEHDTDTSANSFGAASVWVKTKILLAGVVMNVVAAFAILTILGWFGMPNLLPSQFSVNSNAKVIRNDVLMLVTSVTPNSPAQHAGLKPDDNIEKIGPVNGNLKTLNSSSNLPNITKSLAGDRVNLVYQRGNRVYEAQTTLLTNAVVAQSQNTKNPKGILGVGINSPTPITYTLTRYTWAAPIVAVGLIKQITVLTFKGLGTVLVSLLHGNASKAGNQVTGPVGIFYILKNGSTLGYQFILIFLGVISLTLAIINVLPIPALDGGRLFMILITHLVRHPLKKRTEEIINGASFALLLLLIVIITINDIKKNG